VRCASVLAQLGWTRYFRTHFHQHYKSTNPTLASLPHPAAPFLARLARHGVPALCSDTPWSLERQDAAMARGPHPSAARHFPEFLLEDMYDYALMGYWMVLPYSAVRGHPHLRIAPAGVVPQRERRPRPIMDYSYNGVNQASVPLAPLPAMQFGAAFQRLLQRLAYCNPQWGPPLLAKIDLANGYYRVPLSPAAALQLAVCLPPDGSGDRLLGIPLSLPMGWSLSPPYFFAFTETCADLNNNLQPLRPHHPHQRAAEPTLPLPAPRAFSDSALFPFNPVPPPHPLQYTEVYIDDFMLAVQRPHHVRLMHSLLHHLHSVFRDPSDSPRRAVVSESKVKKGDATFSTEKIMLGWHVDTHRMTVHLPAHRVQRLSDILQTALTSRYTTRIKWQKLLGELHSMVPAIHSSRYLFSILHHHLAQHTSRRKRLTRVTRQALLDWKTLLLQLGSTPMHISHLVPQAPHVLAATDASKDGMGGFWLPTNLTTGDTPCAWRYQWPTRIRQAVVTTDNPTGTLSINDLELAAITAAVGLQTTQPRQHDQHHCVATDNKSAQAWVNSGSPTTITAPAYLLRLLAQYCRSNNVSVQAVYTPGSTNTVADLLSRAFHLSDSELLSELDRLAPSKQPWKLVTLPVPLISQVNSALSKRLPQEVSPPPVRAPRTQHGPFGANFVSAWHATPSYKTSKSPYRCSRFSLTDIEWEKWLPLALRSKVEQWRQPFVPWGRRSPHWATEIPGCSPRENWIFDYSANCRPTQRTTHLLPE
jgi:hypothetical protein